MSEDNALYPSYNLEVGRCELHEAQGKVLVLDSCTGTLWAVKHLDGKPVMVLISSAQGKGIE